MMMAPQRPTSRFQGCLPIGLTIGVVFVGELCWISSFPSTVAANLFSMFLLLATLAGAVVWVTLWFQHRKKQAEQQVFAAQQAERQAFLAAQQHRIAQEERARQQVLEEERKERERIAHMDSIGKLLALSPREFEEVICRMLIGLGVLQKAKVVGGAGDRGADIIGTTRDGDTFIVQCKRYVPGSRIGTPDIQRFIGAIHIHQADRGVFVTTCSFSDPAIELAKEHNILLADGEDCIELLQRLSSQGQ